MKADGHAVAASFDGRTLSSPVSVADLRPRDVTGGFYLGCSVTITALSLHLSLSPVLWIWLSGQLFLAVAMLQWFAVLHEAGHKTLFRTRWLNKWAAHIAGFAALIPADCWRIVHAKHHYWTGWQDLDITTQMVVPRRLHAAERLAINLCWRLWLPLFATLYRVNNYWRLPRLWRLFPRVRERRLIVANVLGYALLYGLLAWSIGVPHLLRLVGLALLISFAFQDLLILSQHTHIPMPLAKGEPVEPFPPLQQEAFTRSLVFPLWFSRLILLNFDAHGLHHMYPKAPGYDLHRLQKQPANSIRWWEWIWRAKSVPGDVLLFQNRDETGFYF